MQNDFLRNFAVEPPHASAMDLHFAADFGSLASPGITIHEKHDDYLGYWNEYPLASFPDMNLVLYSSK